MANHDRSGMQTAADLARMAKAAVRIARAAAAAGLHGAAVAAAKEALPYYNIFGLGARQPAVPFSISLPKLLEWEGLGLTCASKDQLRP